ncbi:hypothetical protein PRZ48_000037 [Zasmidium cellare]|uniref:Luciferase domain-containing protein n=1 Tax=Zasmidium cellare TaxID=395010 RepID=A0ABR0EXG2_ZASCE|nr:hypothetical protein PRZ48_000037 [Zasmidium cellare]
MESLQHQALDNPLAFGASAAAITAALVFGAWIYRDYTAWIDFGTGGTSANFSGYLRITKFRLLRAFSGDDLKDASSLSPDGLSYLPKQLPRREGQLPAIIERTLPQRQYPAKTPLDKAAYDRLHALPKKYAEQLNDALKLDKSVTEGRTTDAIYALPAHRHGAHDRVLGDEIAHVHPAENSLHVWLTEADTYKVVSAGWGERFPLASLGMVNAGWTFVYAPRSMEEVAVVEEIFKAGIGHLTGKRP